MEALRGDSEDLPTFHSDDMLVQMRPNILSNRRQEAKGGPRWPHVVKFVARSRLAASESATPSAIPSVAGDQTSSTRLFTFKGCHCASRRVRAASVPSRRQRPTSKTSKGGLPAFGRCPELGERPGRPFGMPKDRCSGDQRRSPGLDHLCGGLRIDPTIHRDLGRGHGCIE